MSDETTQDWLTRLSAEEWLAAAQGELERATTALAAKDHRAGVTQARRAAGMAWNGVLQGIADAGERARYGRSYMDHLRTLKEETSVPAPLRAAAAALVEAPLQPVLVQLGAADMRLADAAALLVAEARRRVAGEGRS